MSTSVRPTSSDVRTPAWQLLIAGTDITRAMHPYVTQLKYLDHAEGKSDEVEVTVENRDGRWVNAWYPSKASTLELFVGYSDAPLMPCGLFEVDELEVSSPPSTFTIRAIAAGIREPLRTKRSTSFEGQTLREIATRVATANGLTLSGDIADVHVQRATQNDATDLSFLYALSRRYGHLFSVRGSQLVFHRIGALEAVGAVLTLNATRISKYRLKDKTHQTYGACEFRYDDPRTKTVIHERVTDPRVTSNDVLTITGEKADSSADAILQATAALHAANRGETKGELSFAGEQRAVAGNNAQLVGFGTLDGKYTIQSSTHEITRREGYTTTVTVERV